MSWRQNPNPCVKPPFGSMIDPGHPLAKGLVGCWLFNEAQGLFINNPAKNLTGRIQGSLAWKNGLEFDGNEANFVQLQNMQAQIESKTVFSIACKTTWGSSATDEAIIEFSDTIESQWYENAIILYGDDVGKNRDDVVSFFMSSNNTIYRVESAAGIKVAGATMAIVATFNAPTMRLYIDGAEDPNSPVSGLSTTDSSLRQLPWIGKEHADADSQKPHQGGIEYVYFYSSTLTSENAEQLAAEPYCFIAWPSHRVIFDYGAGGGLSIPVAMSNYLRQMGA